MDPPNREVVFRVRVRVVRAHAKLCARVILGEGGQSQNPCPAPLLLLLLLLARCVPAASRLRPGCVPVTSRLRSRCVSAGGWGRE